MPVHHPTLPVFLYHFALVITALVTSVGAFALGMYWGNKLSPNWPPSSHSLGGFVMGLGMMPMILWVVLLEVLW